MKRRKFVSTVGEATVETVALAIEAATNELGALRAEYQERFGTQALADATLLGAELSASERCDLGRQIDLKLAEIDALNLRRRELYEERERQQEMERDHQRQELEGRRASLCVRSQELRDERDGIEHDIRKIDGQLQVSASIAKTLRESRHAQGEA